MVRTNGNWSEGKPLGRPISEWNDWITCQIERTRYKRLKILALKRDVHMRVLLTTALDEFLQREENL
jgi:hypothetical protein